MTPKFCKECNIKIPQARLEAIPDTEYCVEHSDVKPYRAIVTGTAKHKSFEVQIVKADDPILEYEESTATGDLISYD